MGRLRGQDSFAWLFLALGRAAAGGEELALGEDLVAGPGPGSGRWTSRAEGVGSPTAMKRTLFQM